MPDVIATAAKAWVATIATACAPIVIEATNSLIATVATVLVGGVAVYLTPNRPKY